MKSSFGKGLLYSFSSKMIIAYSVLIFCTLTLIAIYLAHNISGILSDREKSYSAQITRNIAEYMDSSIRSAKEVVQRMYLTDGGSHSQVGILSFLEDNGEQFTFDYLNERRNFDKLFSSSLIKDSNILDIIVYKVNTKKTFVYSRAGRNIDADYDFSRQEWFRHSLDDGSVLKIIPTYKPEYVKGSGKLVYTAVASIFNYSNKTVAMVMVNMDAVRIQEVYAKYNKDIRGYYMVFDDAGHVLYDERGLYYDKPYPYFDKLVSSEKYVQLEHPVIVQTEEIPREGIKVVGIIPKAEILKSINPMVRAIYLAILLFIVVSIIFVYVISRFLSRNIRSLTHVMVQVERGHLDARVPVNQASDEIGFIARKFNQMLERLGTYLDRVYYSELRTKEAELSALQMQVNPHFLFNALESIRMKAVINRNEEVSGMIYALANLFRSSLNNANLLVTIRDDIEYCLSYLEIHVIKYRERLRIQFDIPEELQDYAIPKLLLQPLIENCVNYGGLEEGKELLTVTLRGKLDGDRLVISIEDDGVGMTQEVQQQLRDLLLQEHGVRYRGNLGLKNANERIKKIFGEEYGLDWESHSGEGTIVRIVMPAKTIGEMNEHV